MDNNAQEADIRMAQHTAYSVNGAKKLVILSADTDVFKRVCILASSAFKQSNRTVGETI